MELRGFVGNEPLKRTLRGTERLSHAVIISGPKGSGRHTLARLLAQSFVCTGAQAPCGECPHCKRVSQGIHPDVMDLSAFVEPSELEKDVKVGTVRDLRADAQIRPNQAARKVYLIDRPINPNAQNAMLKLLEEGPSYAAFLLLTDNPENLLETVRSRCARLSTSPVTTAEAAEYLLSRYPDRDRAAVLRAADAGQGLIGRSIALLEAPEEDDGTAALAAQWLEAIASGSELALMERAVAIQTGKFSRDAAERLYTAIGAGLRDAAVCASGAAPHPSELTSRLAQALPVPCLLALYELTEQAREMCAFNVAPAHSSGWLSVSIRNKSIRNSRTAGIRN